MLLVCFQLVSSIATYSLDYGPAVYAACCRWGVRCMPPYPPFYLRTAHELFAWSCLEPRSSWLDFFYWVGYLNIRTAASIQVWELNGLYNHWFLNSLLVCRGGFGTGSLCSQTVLLLTVHLPQPPVCWDYRHGPPTLVDNELFLKKKNLRTIDLEGFFPHQLLLFNIYYFNHPKCIDQWN
jgi:hypothetical protein